MKSLSTLIQPGLLEPSRHKHEFQEVCTQLEPIYGKAIWTVPSRADATEFKIRKAHEIAVKRGKPALAYLIGVLKRL